MDCIQESERLKVLDIVERLQLLDCTLIGNRDESWITELLFKPGPHRLNLIEWILSRFGYGIQKILTSENLAEERIKNLQSAIYDLGIYREKSSDIVKGTAPMNEQLEFWYMLVDILWLKCTFAELSLPEDGGGIVLSHEKTSEKCIYEEFPVSSCTNKICESVNIKHLFQTDLQLLAPDVQREIEQMSEAPVSRIKIPSLPELKKCAKVKIPTNFKDAYKSCMSQTNISVQENKNESVSENKLKELEEELHKVTLELREHALSGLTHTYDDLQPLMLQIKPDVFIDVGSSFNGVVSSMENLTQLEESLFDLDSSNDTQNRIIVEIDDIINQKKFEDQNLITLLKMLQDTS